jgi:16S rRNA (adenine1518-N6/adenine1519-N6)-dimethyltransferase
VSVAEIRALLERHELRLHRDRGQNFLVDPALADRLARSAGVGPGDTVIEIGTGLGILTRALAARALRVVTVEVDAGLVRALRAEGALPANAELVHADALRLDLGALASAAPGPVRVVANLPYSSATPILRRLLDLRGRLEDWSVTLQREVARRLLAPVGSRDYGSLSVLHQLCARARRELDLHPRCFFPAPRVTSSFLRIVPLRPDPLAAGELEAVERVARAAFQQRRKTASNALRAAGLGEEVEEALAEAGADPRARPAEIPPERYLALARRLRERAEG